MSVQVVSWRHWTICWLTPGLYDASGPWSKRKVMPTCSVTSWSALSMTVVRLVRNVSTNAGGLRFDEVWIVARTTAV